MRLVLIPLLLFATAPAWAATPSTPPLSTPPPSATNLVRLHPAPWRLPEPALRAGLRFEPETGETAAESPGFGRSATRASLRAQAEARVRTLPDGSRHAVVGAAFRSWAVASVDGQGRLVQDCVHGEDEALRRVEAAATRKQVRK